MVNLLFLFNIFGGPHKVDFQLWGPHHFKESLGWTGIRDHRFGLYCFTIIQKNTGRPIIVHINFGDAYPRLNLEGGGVLPEIPGHRKGAWPQGGHGE